MSNELETIVPGAASDVDEIIYSNFKKILVDENKLNDGDYIAQSSGEYIDGFPCYEFNFKIDNIWRVKGKVVVELSKTMGKVDIALVWKEEYIS